MSVIALTFIVLYKRNIIDNNIAERIMRFPRWPSP